MSQACGNCKWYDSDFAPADDPADALGLCTWPVARLPYSLRWGNRERMAVGPLEGETCATFEPKESDAPG